LELIRGTAALERRLVRPVLTIGNFDGVHLGHRAILDTVISRARALDGEAVLYTFDPHPRKVLQPDGGPRLLVTLEQKAELLEEIGLDVLIVEPFDLDFARTPPEVFVRDFIHQRIGPMEVYVGYDFHFGRDREGSMRLLTETGPLLGFSVTIISEVTVCDRDVNSTRIRELLSEGNVDEAGTLLGRPFSVRSSVVEGDRRGRDLGFPTANLAPVNEILPGPGVYSGQLRLLDDGVPERDSVLAAVTNVGYRPTFQDGRGLIAEAHVIDFEGDLYGRKVELVFVSKLRSEQKFDSVDELRAQIARDVDAARVALEKT
jgi:riboflavin kinase/FMN adenylyltransferase